jgi:hypothetical protein
MDLSRFNHERDPGYTNARADLESRCAPGRGHQRRCHRRTEQTEGSIVHILLNGEQSSANPGATRECRGERIN